MSLPSQTTWVTGTTRWTNTTYANSYSYNSRVCHGCGNNDVETGCLVNYAIPNASAKHDWNYNQTPCGASTDTSSVSCLDYTVCPNIGGIQAQVQWGYNNDSTVNPWLTSNQGYVINNSANQGTNVDCIYPLSTFVSYDAVNKFKTYFPSQVDDPNSDYNQKILPFFCLSQSSNCPVSDVYGVPMPACSRFVANGEEGAICRAWSGYSNSGAPLCGNQTTSTDALLYEYCSVYNDQSCMCISRDANPVYQVMTVGNPAASNYPTCFWSSCQSKTKYLVPTDLACCPENENTVICNTINVVLGQESTGLSFNPTQYTTCEVNPNNGGGGTLSEGGIWMWIILAVIVIIVIIIVILVLLL